MKNCCNKALHIVIVLCRYEDNIGQNGGITVQAVLATCCIGHSNTESYADTVSMAELGYVDLVLSCE